ncbi:MAG: hypothetical protein HY913_03115 [Desulfomonile tiedjei]|nr:hypothetical protein [Desulfomonile tiedjei]
MDHPSGIPRWVLAIVSCLFVAIPFAITQFPPITDLPQESAQIRLLVETLKDPSGSPYTIQWYTPRILSYLILGASWGLFGGMDAGRAAMAAIGLLWIVAIHVIAQRRNRSAASATLASLFFFNHIIYWGFYSFAVGWPAFLIWFSLTTKKPAKGFSASEALIWIGTGLLLYMSHVLWLVAGIAWLLIHNLVFRSPARVALTRAAYVIPLVVVIAIWYPILSASTMDTPALWGTNPISRLSFDWLTDAALGGIRGPLENVIFGLAVGWILLSVWQNRREIGERIDWELLLAAGMFFVFVLALPDKYMNTIRFANRWMPIAVILLILAMPAPTVRPLLRQGAAILLLAAFCVPVSFAWLTFEKKELSGLPEALQALPNSPRLLGLNMVHQSEIVRGYPFIQMFAYGQVMKGGILNFSFAEFAPCLVVYKERFIRQWTGGLEWFPDRVKESDLNYFDWVLINGTQQTHAIAGANPRMVRVTPEGRWRLYKVVPAKE